MLVKLYPSEIPHWLERKSVSYKGVEPFFLKTRFKSVRLMTICNRPKRIISTSGGFDYYKWHQSQTLGGVPVRTLGSKGGGL